MAKKKTQSRKKPLNVLLRLPKGHTKKRPFTLMWVETAIAERLQQGDLAFSERVKGLSPDSFCGVGVAEKFESSSTTY